ncbi:1,2-oxophytodienoate reductase [Actinoplanes sp. SE50]|uniref:alkene reductase n=1 Tax=unclassified Actinoplanes TaxID=2626549 RepID=UPI00023ED688|nr:MULTISPECIES: alkene reductase [unclassified Actinoplanes]AEV86797.1 N-ethylmaleimide reductase [Actinoplanes sp. SE50/110]ATO85194.1 1,2-oxophytodienoate reductase [Actinoplanes sp. SE50]SLM02604.1 alkene reductase [Actinoplanes sp. SE50/110]
MSTGLFEPFPLGDLTLANRMVMAPLTRNRADHDGVVTPMMVTHYRQRATTGLIISESTPVSAEGVGYPNTPGIHTEAQAAGWLRLTEAVHAESGRVFVQLQHCGRISHPSLLPDGSTPVAPSALRPSGQTFTPSGLQEFVMPRELEAHEVPEIVAQFEHAAKRALDAGFDGVEVHAGNGYLVDQFLRDATNIRTDAYGGSPRNRMRLLNEILDAVCAVWPAHRVGVRFTPENSFNSMADTNPQAHFRYFLEQLRTRDLAYVHMLEGDMTTKTSALDYRALRDAFTGTYIANNGYDLPRAQTAIRDGAADLIAFGVPFLANPDLVRRYRDGLPLNTADPSTYYTGGPLGYIDYPTYDA